MYKILILPLVLFMGACASPQQIQHIPTKPVTKPIVHAPVIPQKPRKHSEPSQPISKPAITSQQVLGKGEGWLRQHFGRPDFTRTDFQASIWMYRNKSCVLNLFLYSETTPKAPLTVMHFDARNTQGQNMNRDTCLASF